MENFSFKCSKIVKNALYLKKGARTVTHEFQKVNGGGYLFLLSNQSACKVLFTHECQKVNGGGYLFLLSNQSACKVLFTCLESTNYKYTF